MSTTLDRLAQPMAGAARTDPFRPSEYTGLLIQTLNSRANAFTRGTGLDMGMGSGVLLGTLGLLGVERLYGVDIDPDALRASERLVGQLGLLDRTQLLQGSLWEPIGDTRFDVVVTNLPNFPATEPSDPDRSPFWSVGGPDGRKLIDPFIQGLRPHLRDDGVAFMTHNVFADVATTQAVLARHGLSSSIVLTTSTVLHPVKSAMLNPRVRAKYNGLAIRRLGPYEFVDVQVLEIRPT